MLNYAGGTPVTAYNLTRSLRFRASASAYLNRTVGTPTNNKIFTVSFWVKRGSLGSRQGLIGACNSVASNYWMVQFDSADTLTVYDAYAPSTYNLTTTQVFRDPSAWYHIVVAVDTTQATASNRTKIYVNGIQVTSFSASNYPSQNANTYFNTSGTVASVGSWNPYTVPYYFDGYQTEINMVDGQALTPSSFGSTNALTGVWQPAKYSGSYGTNGFYLPFTDNSALTTSSNVGLGKDFSGNGNYWVTNNISITTGVTYDSMTDVPTLTSATAANFAVLNPLNAESGMTGTPSNGNLTISVGGGKRSTIAARTGKFYWEFISTSGAASNFPISGLYVAGTGTFYPGLDANSVGYFQGGDIYYNGSIVFTASSFTDNDLIGFAWDADTGKFWVAKNGTWQNSGNPAAGTGQVATISTGVDRVVGAYLSTGSCSINFGQRPFTYTPPSGFLTLNTYNIPTSTILKGNSVMDATLYTGTLLSNAVTNAAAFRPDLVWVKSRSAATDNKLTDSVRGVTKGLISNTTGAETTDTQGVTAFGSAGFTVGTNTDYNNLAATYVAWQWQAGQGSSGANTNGTITSTVSVNASAGFSVATYTGSGANATIGHGLGVAPQFIIVKSRSGVIDWRAYHASVGNANYLSLNLSDASAASAATWNNTSPTSSVFSVGTALNVNNAAATYVAYCWASIAGFSAFGSYTGNGSASGPFVYLGFRPKFVLFKRTDAAENWLTKDTTRNPYNAVSADLYPSLANVEDNSWAINVTANGFQVTATGSLNTSGGTYVYMAFASNPFKNSLAF